MRSSLLISLAVLFVFASWAIAADKVILIAGAIPLAAGDAAFKTHLEKLGYTVEEHNQTEKQPVSIVGAAAVYVLESISSANIANAYKTAAIPVITTEAYILDDMKFAPDATFDTTAGTTLTIEDATSPIAGGLKGEVKITTTAAEICSCSGMAVQGKVIAKAGTSKFPCLITFEKGMKDMDGTAIPARRVFAFAHTNLLPNLTNEGWGLIERSFLWAMGKLSETPVEPVDKLSITWGGIKM
jgi:hypothetical protein